MSAAHDPGTPEARRAWLDSLPDGSMVYDDCGASNMKLSGVWFEGDEQIDAVGMSAWCHWDGYWPAAVAFDLSRGVAKNGGSK